MRQQILRPDAKGRITLGLLAQGVSGFQVDIDSKQNIIILKPLIEIPAAEQWLFNNPKALKQVQTGLKESGLNRLSSRGRFGQYLKDE